ncbi:hypothetical protein MTO96_028745 [Rhipicephalus appendiculatus]
MLCDSRAALLARCATAYHAMCVRYTQTHVWLPGTFCGLYRELASAGVPGLSPFVCAPTAAAPRNGSFALPATGAHRVRTVRRWKLEHILL